MLLDGTDPRPALRAPRRGDTDRGTVLIHQKMFESRLFFVDKLIDMGAQIILCDPHRAVVVGQDHASSSALAA